jgi:hypothetical protein
MRIALLGLLLLLAGCAAKSPGPAPAQDPIATPPAEPETLYLLPNGNGGSLEPEPDGGGMDGSGFLIDGGTCPQSHPVILDQCWGMVYAGSSARRHTAGSHLEAHFWVQFARPSSTPPSLRLVLGAGNATVLNATVPQQVSPTAPGTPAPGPDGCVELRADIPLAQAVAAGQELTLDLQVRGFVGTDCTGGGEQGSRIVLGKA